MSYFGIFLSELYGCLENPYAVLEWTVKEKKLVMGFSQGTPTSSSPSSVNGLSQ